MLILSYDKLRPLTRRYRILSYQLAYIRIGYVIEIVQILSVMSFLLFFCVITNVIYLLIQTITTNKLDIYLHLFTLLIISSTLLWVIQ